MKSSRLSTMKQPVEVRNLIRASKKLWRAFPDSNYTVEQHLAFGEVAEALRALRIRAIRNTKRSR